MPGDLVYDEVRAQWVPVKLPSQRVVVDESPDKRYPVTAADEEDE